MERLQKLLAQAGIASRRHAEEMILAGRVRVNGAVVTELGAQADPENDKIMVDNQPVSVESKVYYILNKPRGYISDRDDTAELKTALDLIPDGRRLFAAGRLDLMSEGMLLLTNDGELANHLTHPRYEHEKEYLALVYGTPDDKTIARLEKGVLYDGEWMRADIAERAGRNQDVGEAGRDETWLRIVLHEGKKRQIRHMCAALGHAVKRLVRVRMGALRLGSLKVGEWRKLTKDEIVQLKKTREREPKSKRITAPPSSAPQAKSTFSPPAQKPSHAPRDAGKEITPRGERKQDAHSEGKHSTQSPSRYAGSPRPSYKMRGEARHTDTAAPKQSAPAARFKGAPRPSYKMRGEKRHGENDAPNQSAAPSQYKGAPSRERGAAGAKPRPFGKPRFQTASREPYAMRGEGKLKHSETAERPADKPSRFKSGPRDSFTVRGKRKLDGGAMSARPPAKARAPKSDAKPAAPKPNLKKRDS